MPTTRNPEMPSVPEHSQRDQVISAFRKFVDQGIKSPDDLDLDNPEVIEANRILDNWNANRVEEAESSGTQEARLEYSLDRSTVLIDAGFSDEDYLDEVANDWLLQNDLPEAEAAGLSEIAAKIRARADEINKQIRK